MSIGKKEENSENVFFKALANRFQLTSKLINRVKEKQSCLWPIFYQIDFMKRCACVCACVCVRVRVRVCVCVCVCTSINREGFICLDIRNASEQINDVMLKTWIFLRHFRMKLRAFSNWLLYPVHTLKSGEATT